VKEGTLGNVRILDAAIVPVKPVAPKKARVLALSLLLGLAGGVALAFARRALDQGIEDPEVLEREFSIGVHASVPQSARQRIVASRARPGEGIPVLARVGSDDLAVESLRSLRTSLQFALLEATSNIVTVGGPAPNVGKSFVTVNLAHLLGEAGKRVLVVDADMRRGHLHRYYAGERAPGLSDVIAGAASLADAVRETASHNVHFLATGAIPPNPSELLASERFARTLAQLSAGYDLVLLDTPPILAVTDAAILGRLAGVNLLVLRAGRHPLREITAALRALGRGGVRVHGFVLNGVQLDRGLGRKNTFHYQYKY
jgi:tyrosine-protein kinase Etk/Wzc